MAVALPVAMPLRITLAILATKRGDVSPASAAVFSSLAALPLFRGVSIREKMSAPPPFERAWLVA